MKELTKRFIGERCIIYTIIKRRQCAGGVIKEIDDGGMVIEKNSGELEDHQSGFRHPYSPVPEKENGKKKRHRAGLNAILEAKI